MTKLKVLLIIVLTVSGCASPHTIRNRGIMYYNAGNYAAAISALKESIDIQPTTTACHYLGCAYYNTGAYDAAIEQFKKAIEREPEDPINYNWIGGAYWNKKQYKDAIVYSQKGIARGTTNTVTFWRLANCYNELNQYNNAIKAGTRGIELDFSNDAAHFELACAFFKTKQYKNAVKAYKKAIELAPKLPGYYYRWGYLLMESGDYAGAAEQYEKAISLKPNNFLYLLSLSRLSSAYYKQGKYDEARDATNKAVFPMSLVGIGSRIHIVEDYPVVHSVFESGPAEGEGIKAGDKIIKIDGESTKGWKSGEVVSRLRGQKDTRVVLTIERGDSKESLEATVTRERIFTAAASTGIGYRSIILRQMGKQEEALKDAKQAYSLNSSDRWAQLALGASNLDQGRYDEAIKLLSQVKGSNTARILEATAYARKGDFKRAVDIYSAIPEEKLSPENVPLWSDRAALLHSLKPFVASKKKNAGKLKAQARHKEALRELGDAMKIVDDTELETICREIAGIIAMDPALSAIPEEARKYALRGDMLTEQGEFEDAVKEYRQAVQAAPYIAKLYFNTAMIYGELKKYFQATHYMKTYLQLAPQAPNVRAAKDQIYKWEFMMEKKK